MSPESNNRLDLLLHCRHYITVDVTTLQVASDITGTELDLHVGPLYTSYGKNGISAWQIRTHYATPKMNSSVPNFLHLLHTGSPM